MDHLSEHDAPSAGPAQEPGSGQRQGRSADSDRRFTSAQQAVAAALMVVMKRAIRGGREAAAEAKLTLVCNNLATRPMLDLLPEEGLLPTVKHLEQRASDQLLQGLTKLANQCKAARCQPLEVFTRSLQCTAHRAAANSSNHGRCQSQEREEQRMMLTPSLCQAIVQAVQQLGMQQSVAALMLAFLQVLQSCHGDKDQDMLAEPCINHMLPGKVHCCIIVAVLVLSVRPVLFLASVCKL